jgi:hypothetical protein
MKKLLALLVLAPTFGWAAYQPVTGSTITVVPPTGGSMPASQFGAPWLVQGASATTSLIATYTPGQQYLTQTTTGTLRVDLSTLGGTTLTQTSGAQDINIKSGSIANTSFIASQAVDSTLNASVSIKGSSNTVQITGTPAVNVSQVGGSAVTTAVAGQLRNSVEISGSSNTVQGGLSDNGAAAATNRLATLGGVTQSSYENGTAATVGRNSAQSHGTDGLLWTAQLPSMRPAWFSASTNTWTLASAATDITALCGNASNTVIVTGLTLSCTQTTAGNITVQVVKRSTKFTGAWSTMTAVGMNSNYAVTNSTAVFFTANPTVGTLLAPIDAVKIGAMAAATATANDIYISPADWRNKALALNGAAECVAVNLLGATVTGGACSARWTWIETATIVP